MEEILKQASMQVGLALSEEQIRKFAEYGKNLVERNERLNLTAITDYEGVAIKHFVDSILVCKFMDFSQKTVIDIGTGAGFPGVPIRIYSPNSKVTLVDTLQKRVKYLQQLSRALEISPNIVWARAEELGKDPEYREKYDFCVSRAVANLSVLCEYCMPFVKVGGFFVSYKATKAEEEVKQAENAISVLGGKTESVEKITLPIIKEERHLIFIKKISETPLKYPRKQSKISKKSL